MTREDLITALWAYKGGSKSITDMLAAVEAYSSASNKGNAPVGGSLPPLPDWDEVVKGIDDSRFYDLPNCYPVREGARIMYDRLYSMLSRRQ